jgi:LuxR family maltose regulon positive regulatory protein
MEPRLARAGTGSWAAWAELSTHLSFPEIAGEMFMSRTRIKSQAMSIYRKLGASSRSQAVARSRELRLLQG